MQIVKPFGKTDKQPTSTEDGWCGSFESKTELEEHILFGQHGGMDEKSSLDAVRNIFVNKMKSLSQVHCSTLSTVQTVQSTVINNEYTTMFKKVGWALLTTRSNFRYTNKQKQVLHGYFMEGEESGNCPVWQP